MELIMIFGTGRFCLNTIYNLPASFIIKPLFMPFFVVTATMHPSLSIILQQSAKLAAKSFFLQHVFHNLHLSVGNFIIDLFLVPNVDVEISSVGGYRHNHAIDKMP